MRSVNKSFAFYFCSSKVSSNKKQQNKIFRKSDFVKKEKHNMKETENNACDKRIKSSTYL